MKHILLLLALLLPATLVAQTLPSDQPTRGYEAETINFDLNDDWTYTDASVCDEGPSTSGVVAVDYDSDGTTEGEIYVSSLGSDFGSCGGTTDPCETIQYALDNRTGTQDGEDAICIYDSTLTEGNINWDVAGDAGTKTKIRSGLEVRDFQYPSNPIMLVGADADGDGLYPPEDTDDTAVLDASGFHKCFTFSVDRVEFAHFTARDCGDEAAPSSGNAGFAWELQHHSYFHNLKLLNINRARRTDAEYKAFQGNQGNFTYLAVENVLLSENGGFGFRGGQGQGTPTGPMRWENVTRTALGADGFGEASMFDYWGYMTGVELFSSIIDGNHGGWVAQNQSEIGHNTCSRDLHLVNNTIIDTRVTIQHSDSGFCNSPGRPGGGTVLIAGNSFITSAGYDKDGWIGLLIAAVGSTHIGANRFQGVITVVNNIAYAETGSSGKLNGFVTGEIGNQDTAYGAEDKLIVANNTVIANGCWNSPALLNFDSDDTHIFNNVQLYNNYIKNIGAGTCDNVDLNYAPSAWASDNNIFEPSSDYIWNNSDVGDLAGWQSASGGDANSSECDATFEDAANRDYHLSSEDDCALDNGATLLAVTDSDYDGPDNRPVDSWDVGADEVEEGEDPPAPDPGDGIVLSGSGLDGSNTQ